MNRRAKKRAGPTKGSRAHKLTPQQAQFVDLYVATGQAAESYMAVYGCSLKAAAANASRLLTIDKIVTAVAGARAAMSERTKITQDMVLDRWWQLANSDARELVEFRRTCCRHCYGVGFGFQLTNAEKVRIQTGPVRSFYETDEEGEEWKRKQANKKGETLPMQIGDVLRDTPFGPLVFGGIGWDPRKDPNPDCPECFGHGLEKLHVHDTRKLSPAAVSLYAGAKKTQAGVEVKLHDPKAALQSVAKFLGMEKLEITLPPGWQNLPPAELLKLREQMGK